MIDNWRYIGMIALWGENKSGLVVRVDGLDYIVRRDHAAAEYLKQRRAKAVEGANAVQ